MPLLTQSLKPRVILGLMTFGPDVNAGARVTSLTEYTKILDTLQQSGYNEIDTARAYVGGKQEGFTREAGWQEKGFKLATKVYPFSPGIHKPQTLREYFDTSLKELGTNCVDIFYLHAADRSVPFAETLEEVNKFHKEGKFVQLGLSNYTAFEVAEVVMTCKANGWVRPTIYQGMYNCITRSLEQEVIPACKRYGLEVVVYNPIAGGLLSGRYTTKDSIPLDGRFSDEATKSQQGAAYRKRYFRDSVFEALKTIEAACQAHGLTMVETALRWCMHHSALQVLDGPDGLIIGASSLAQLESNLKDCEKGPLPEEVVEALDKAWLLCKPDAPNYWHLDLKYTYDTRKALGLN